MGIARACRRPNASRYIATSGATHGGAGGTTLKRRISWWGRLHRSAWAWAGPSRYSGKRRRDIRTTLGHHLRVHVAPRTLMSALNEVFGQEGPRLAERVLAESARQEHELRSGISALEAASLRHADDGGVTRSKQAATRRQSRSSTSALALHGDALDQAGTPGHNQMQAGSGLRAAPANCPGAFVVARKLLDGQHGSLTELAANADSGCPWVERLRFDHVVAECRG